MENDESHWDNKVYFSSKNVTQRKLITFRTPLKKKWDGELIRSPQKLRRCHRGLRLPDEQL